MRVGWLRRCVDPPSRATDDVHLSVLALEPGDPDALVSKIVANIQLTQYDAALALIGLHGAALGDSVAFLKV